MVKPLGIVAKLTIWRKFDELMKSGHIPTIINYHLVNEN
jgi:hypothetical protein